MACKSILDLALERYAVKEFTGELVEEEKVKRVLEVARLSPTSYNLQPARVLWLRGERAKAMTPLSYNQRNVETASDLLVFLTIIDKERLLEENFAFWKSTVGEERAEKRRKFFEGLFSTLSREEFKCWMEKQTYIVLGFSLLAAVGEGLGSCPLEGFEKDKYRKALELPPYLEPSVALAVGVPKDKPKEKARIPLEQFVWRKI